MGSIENIKTEKTRIKTILDSKNNPSIPFAITIIAAFISILFSLFANNIIKDFYTAGAVIGVFSSAYLYLICESQQKWDSLQKFYMSSLQVLDIMENKKLKKRR
ncbi:hypothetical protein ACYZFO_10650 [Clostridioides difficile]